MSAATLTLADYRRHALHAVDVSGATLPPGTTQADATTQIVNQAGRHMYLHPFGFRRSRPQLLDFKAPLDLEGLTWDENTRSLTLTDAFAGYQFAEGDFITIASGTGATAGPYMIASRSGDNAIVLEQSIGADADGQTDIAGEISFPYIALPADFVELISVRPNNQGGAFLGLQLATLDEVLARRFSSQSIAGDVYLAALEQSGQTAADSGAPAMRLALDHAPAAALPGALVMSYWRGWTTLVNDDDVPNFMPGELESLLIEYVRAFAEGYMNRHADEDGVTPEITLQDRLREIEESTMFARLLQVYTAQQHSLGPIRNGAASGSRFSDLVTARNGAVSF